jgi:DNA-binding LacI/PurR family transcriptional regulator
MRDVAEHAGVSLSTVSGALRGAPGVTSEVRDRVRQAADELSYVVSRNASSLVTRRTGRVGLLVPRLQRWFFAAVAAALCDSLQEQHLDTVVYQLGDSTAGGEVRSLPLRQNVDSVVAVSLDFADELADQLDELALPTVFCSRRLEGRHCVFIDNAAAARTATQHLLNLGHRDIAYLHSRPLDIPGGNFGDRARGYADAMSAAGLPARFERIDEGSAGGEAGMGRLLGATGVPTAVFAESDETAFGVLRVLRRSAVTVPAAVSVIGFDNHDLSDTFELTTIDQDAPALGRAAGRLAAELATAGIERPARHVRREARLLVRGSTGVPRSDRVLSGAV